jgi:hypothetical protein
MTGLAGVKPSLSRTDAAQHKRPASPRDENKSKRSEWWGEERFRSTATTWPGFLGSTSFSAVFAEHQDQIDLELDQDIADLNREHYEEASAAKSTEFQRKIADGAAVLALLADLPSFEPIATRWAERWRELSLMAPILPACLKSIKTDLYEPFIKMQTERALSNASRLLFRNLLKVLKSPPYCTFEQYTSSLTGENLRWETVGIFFTACGLACYNSSAEDPLLDFVGHRPGDKRLLSRRMLEASNACIAFLDDAGHLNDPGMWLTEGNCILTSQILGDASKLIRYR